MTDTQGTQSQRLTTAASERIGAALATIQIRRFVLIPTLLVLLELSVRIFQVPNYILPSVSEILRAIWDQRGTLITQSVPTAIEIWSGYLIAVIVGFALAVPIAYSRAIEDSVFPILVTLQVIPKVALAPLFLVWLGFGMTPKIAIAVLIALFPIVVNTVKGLRSVDQEMLQWCRTLGASRLQMFFKLSLPWALPYIFAGLKVSIGLATVGAVVGEFIGTNQGIGYVILRAMVNFDTTLIFAGLVIISLIGIASYGVVTLCERYLLAWQASAEDAPETM